jgi:hypothetical protein
MLHAKLGIMLTLALFKSFWRFRLTNIFISCFGICTFINISFCGILSTLVALF